MQVDVTDGCDCAVAELVRWVKGTYVELSVGNSLFHPVPRTGDTADIDCFCMHAKIHAHSITGFRRILFS